MRIERDHDAAALLLVRPADEITQNSLMPDVNPVVDAHRHQGRVIFLDLL